MKIINLQQNTQEWLDFRQTKIGASDIGTICGVNPYKSAASLWKEKRLGETSYTNAAMKRGKDLEEGLRKRVNEALLYNYQPMVAQSDEHDWMIASLDGFDVGAQSILEIKCPMSSEKILSNIPLHYRYQMQHQMAVCGVDQCLLAVLVNEHTMDFSLHTEHRNELIIKEILEKGKAFHESLLRWESPEDCAEQRDDLKPLMDDLFEHRKQMKLMEMQDKEKLDIIKCMADGKSIYSGERKLTKYASKGAIDYSSIPQLNGVDLEPYRKSGKEAWRFS